MLKSWSEEEINNMIANSDDTSGLFANVDNNQGELIIRFTHKSQKPRYRGEGMLRSEMSGLANIYDNIKNNIITNIIVDDYFNLYDLPIDCLKKAEIENLFDGIGINTYEKTKILDRFTDAVSECSKSQLMITKVIFMRDLEKRQIVK